LRTAPAALLGRNLWWLLFLLNVLPHVLFFFPSQASDSVRSAINDLLQVDRVPKQQEDFVLAAGLHLVLEEIDMPNINVTMQVEQSCDYPNNLFSGAHILNQVMAPGTAGYDNATEAYINATRQLIMVC